MASANPFPVFQENTLVLPCTRPHSKRRAARRPAERHVWPPRAGSTIRALQGLIDPDVAPDPPTVARSASGPAGPRQDPQMTTATSHTPAAPHSPVCEERKNSWGGAKEINRDHDANTVSSDARPNLRRVTGRMRWSWPAPQSRGKARRRKSPAQDKLPLARVLSRATRTLGRS